MSSPWLCRSCNNIRLSLNSYRVSDRKLNGKQKELSHSVYVRMEWQDFRRSALTLTCGHQSAPAELHPTERSHNWANDICCVSATWAARANAHTHTRPVVGQKFANGYFIFISATGIAMKTRFNKLTLSTERN